MKIELCEAENKKKLEEKKTIRFLRFNSMTTYNIFQTKSIYFFLFFSIFFNGNGYIKNIFMFLFLQGDKCNCSVPNIKKQ